MTACALLPCLVLGGENHQQDLQLFLYMHGYYIGAFIDVNIYAKIFFPLLGCPVANEKDVVHSGSSCAGLVLAGAGGWTRLGRGCCDRAEKHPSYGKNWPFVLVSWESPGHHLLRCGEIPPANVLVGFLARNAALLHAPPLSFPFIFHPCPITSSQPLSKSFN